MLKNLLLYRLAIFNTCAFAGVAYAAQLGYVRQVFEGDVSHISYGIVVLFALGLVSTAIRAWKVSGMLNHTKEMMTFSALTRQTLGRDAGFDKLLYKQAHIFDISEWLVLLGLAGNVIGFLIAFHGMDTSALGSAAGMQKIGLQVLAGLGVAFYSTLAGTVCALWTSINYRMLDTATRCLIADVR